MISKQLDRAIAGVRILPRYRYQSLSQRHRLGRFVPQVLIPRATHRQIDIAAPINKRGCFIDKVLWIEVTAIRSEQQALRHDKLLWHLRHYAQMQRAKKYPAVIMVRGVPILWDGNHRVTSARLLRKRFIRCIAMFKKSLN